MVHTCSCSCMNKILLWCFSLWLLMQFYQGQIKVGAGGAAAPGPLITTYYELMNDFFVNQLYMLPVL